MRNNNIEDTMKTVVLCLTILGYVVASPNGYYHQEYNYKTSASSYRNNELQHQTDDQGYYRKDGDLEGRVRPKVDANSEHSEYVNPNLKNSDYNTGLIGGANGDLSSYGHMRANIGAYNSHDQSAESLAHSDHISGSRGAYSGYSSGSYGASNFGSGSQSYGMASNLRTVTSRVQQDLEHDLQRAIQENRAYAELERELRQNLTSRLDNELVNRYGQQSIRGGLSYTLSGGRLHSTANYDNQELLDLRRNIENSLLNQLRTQYNQVYSGGRYTYSTTTHRPYYPQYVDVTTYRPITTIRPQYSDHPNYVPYTPTLNQESITTIAARVQNQLDSRLNQILEDLQRTHFSSSSSYSLTNADVLLERLRNELRNNVTYSLEEEIRRNYGTQTQRDGYVYTIGTGGQTASQHSYSVRDLESLRSQIERNLIEKLNRDFERYRTSWNQQYRQSSHSSQNGYREYSTTPRYAVYTTPYTPRYEVYTPQYNTYDADVEPLSNRPSSNHITSLISGSGGSNSQGQYLVAGSGQSGYEVSGSKGISQLQRQLQQDLSSQLQTAISRGHYGYYSGSYNPQSYQASLQQLTDELNRNLTRQLQEYSSNSYYSTYGNIDQAQLASMRSQLQADLLRQLQQGLQQSYHTSSSYSASSSSSSNSANYRPARGFQNYQQGQYRSGGNIALLQGEDCVGDDPNAYTNHRIKRSYQPYRSQPVGLSQTGYNNYRGYNTYNNQPQQQVELGQEIDNADLTQQVEDPAFGKLQLGSQHEQALGQQVDESDLTQQSEDLQLGQQQQTGKITDIDDSTQQVEDGFQKLQLGSQQRRPQTEYGQQEDVSDLTQEVQDNKFGKLQLGSQYNQQQTEHGQQDSNLDLTQQSEDNGFSKLQLGSQQSGQQEDNSDLTQQTVDHGFGTQQSQQTGLSREVVNSDLTQQIANQRYGKPQVGSQLSQQQTELGQREDNSDLTQQTVDQGFGKLQLGSQQNRQQIGLGQQEDNSDLTQQSVDQGFGNLQVGSRQVHRHPGLGQQEDNSDLTQETVDPGFGKLQLGSQQVQRQTGSGQQEDNSDLTQQSVDNGFGKLQLGSQQNHQPTGLGQQEDNSDLTQQYVDHGFGKLQFGSQQSQQQNELGQQEDNSDLTQVEDSGYGQLQLGQQRIPRPLNEFDSSSSQQQVDNTGYRHLSLGSQTQQLRGDQQLNQVELTQHIKQELSKQLKNEIQERLYTISYSSSNNFQRQRLYQSLKNDLSRNITKQLQVFAGSGSSLSPYSISNLQRTLDRDLNLELQEKLNSISRDYRANSGSQISQVNGFTQENQNRGEQINTDITQQAENVDIPQIEDEQSRNTPLFNNQQQTNNLETSQVRADRIQQFLILDQLSNQIKNAVKTKYSENYIGSSKFQRYQDLINELRQNITTELQNHGFVGLQLAELKQRFERKLKLQLEQEISLNEQQRSRQYILPTENLSPDIQQLTQEPTRVGLIQQAEDRNLGSYHDDRFTQQNVDNGRLQLGNQHVAQLTYPNNPLSQQINGNFETPQQSDVQQIVEQPSKQDFNQGRDNEQLTQDELDLNHQVDYNYRHRPLEMPSANLQVGGRPVTRKPINSNQFIQTELDQQQLQNPQQLPALNQNIQQNREQKTDDIELPSKIEPLETDLTQQVDSNQKVDAELNIEPTTPRDNLNPNQLTFTGSNKLEPLPSQSSEGRATRVTSDGQYFTNPQSLSDAEREADLLIQKLREHSRNNPNHPQQSSIYTNPYVNSPSQEVILPNQQQTFDSFNFNQQQKRLVTDLKDELSINLEKAIRDYRVLIHSSGTNSESFNQQLLIDLQKNITKQLQQLEETSYLYNTFSSEQRTKLYQKLQTDLSSQIQNTLRESESSGLSGYGYGPNPIDTPFNKRVNYGQSGQIEQNLESASNLKPLDYQHANTIQNVEPQVTANSNIGVKGRRYPVNGNLPLPPPYPINALPPQPPVVNPPQPQEPQLQSGAPQPVVVPPQVPSETSTITQTETENITDGNLPWWKRFGNKVKQGAQNFKEKYIG